MKATTFVLVLIALSIPAFAQSGSKAELILRLPIRNAGSAGTPSGCIRQCRANSGRLRKPQVHISVRTTKRRSRNPRPLR